MRITSSSFEDGRAIPTRHAYHGEGQNASPPLQWSDLPEETKELALICDDPDAPRPTPWVHWVIYKIPAMAHGLKEAIPPSPKLQQPVGAVQGRNDWDQIGWGGPLPPKGHGMHHYHFRLYALSKPLPDKPGLTKDELLKAIKGTLLAQVELVGTYQRQ